MTKQIVTSVKMSFIGLSFLIFFACVNRHAQKDDNKLDLNNFDDVRNLLHQNISQLKVRELSNINLLDTSFAFNDTIIHGVIARYKSEQILFIETNDMDITRITILSSSVKGKKKPRVGDGFNEVNDLLLNQVPTKFNKYIGLLDLKDDYIVYYFGPLPSDVKIDSSNLPFVLHDLKIKRIVIEDPILVYKDRKEIPFVEKDN